MEKAFLGQEERIAKLRSETGANLNAINYDLNGLLDFKNQSGEFFFNILDAVENVIYFIKLQSPHIFKSIILVKYYEPH